MVDIFKYTKHLLKKIKKLSEEVMDHPSGESIHAFRVEVKKLKALIRLLAWYFPELDKKKLKKLWKLFDTAGAVREWQILAAHIRNSAIPEVAGAEVLKLIRHEEKKAYSNFRRNHKKSGATYTDEIGDYLREFAERGSKINPSGYFNDLNENIKDKWKQKKLAKEAYHELRRDIKELKYNLKVLDNDEGTFIHLFANPEVLNEGDELLGRWHDSVLASEQLQSLITKGELTEDTQRELVKVRKSIMQEAGQWLSKFKAYSIG